MLSVGTVGRFHDTDMRQKEKVETQLMAPKGTDHVFSTFFVFGVSRYDRLQYFLRFDNHLPEGSQIRSIPGIIPPMSYFNNNFMSPKTTK